MSETQIIPKKKLYKENYKKNHTDNENKITLHVSSKKNNNPYKNNNSYNSHNNNITII